MPERKLSVAEVHGFYDRCGPALVACARLNTFYGLRAAAKRDTQKAVDAWLAGIRFSQDVAKGGPLIFAFTGS